MSAANVGVGLACCLALDGYLPKQYWGTCAVYVASVGWINRLGGRNSWPEQLTHLGDKNRILRALINR